MTTTPVSLINIAARPHIPQTSIQNHDPPDQYLTKARMPANVAIANKESFLPGIHATA
jgi:hypothetical protein